MKNKKFVVKEYMDEFSLPYETVKTRIAKIFKLKTRRSPEKPGRCLTVLYDRRNPFIDKFLINYLYAVNIDAGKFAGGHYHHKKQELFYAIKGLFKVKLIDTKSKEEESINIKEFELLYVPPQIAHKVYSEKGGTLLVLATYNETADDEYPFVM